jgi:hypothetical protein
VNGEKGCIQGFVVETERKRHRGRNSHRWEDNIKRNLQEVEWVNIDWIDLPQDRDSW